MSIEQHARYLLSKLNVAPPDDPVDCLMSIEPDAADRLEALYSLGSKRSVTCFDVPGATGFESANLKQLRRLGAIQVTDQIAEECQVVKARLEDETISFVVRIPVPKSVVDVDYVKAHYLSQKTARATISLNRTPPALDVYASPIDAKRVARAIAYWISGVRHTIRRSNPYIHLFEFQQSDVRRLEREHDGEMTQVQGDDPDSVHGSLMIRGKPGTSGPLALSLSTAQAAALESGPNDFRSCKFKVPHPDGFLEDSQVTFWFGSTPYLTFYAQPSCLAAQRLVHLLREVVHVTPNK